MNAHSPDTGGTPGGALPCPPVTLQVDRNGRLLHADERLMREHLALGGEEGGELALPALLDLARHGLRLGMRLSRPVTFAGSAALIDAWCECSPASHGVDLALTHWKESPFPDAPDMPGPEPRLPSDPHAVQLLVDPSGRIIRFDPPHDLAMADARDHFVLRPLADLLVPADGSATASAAQLDGMRVTLAGDPRHWLVRVVADQPARGHLLELTQTQAEDEAGLPPAPPPVFDGERLAHLFGSQIGPALRQPIGRIIANAETIGGRLEGPLRADYASYAIDIASAGRHLLALVDDLADLEAIDSSGFSAAREPVDLADLARRAAGLLALKAADRSIRIDKPADDESLPAIGEFRRVLQVLLNLLGNAINYAPDGSMIWLRLDDGPGWASVTVADQGPGLSHEDQQRLFNKWERLGRSGDGGSGLGLYISRRLALAMDGELTVESAPGQGARFTLTLPVG